MIKATIQNSSVAFSAKRIMRVQEIRFPCSETELSKKLGEIGMNPEHLAPMATVIEIEPSELSVLVDCDVSLDALNYLGKRLDGMDESEHKQYLAALSCDEADTGYSLKNIINLTYNLARFTLIEDMDDVERVGLIHMLNIRGALSESEYQNKEWLVTEGRKLLESDKGIDTEYGKLFINEDIPFEENFNGTTFPPYLYNGSPVAVDIGYMGLTEMVELPCEEIAIKKALCRLGADDILDCKVEVDSTWDITDEWSERISEVEKTKDLFGLNNLLKTVDFSVKQHESIFQKELVRRLCGEGYTVTNDGDWFTVMLNGESVVKISDKDILYTDGNFYDKDKSEVSPLSQIVREIYGYCAAYDKSAPLKAEGLSGKYRCLSEFNGTVLAAKYNEEYGFEFVTWDRTIDGKAVCQGKYFEDYDAAKENFAVRSGLIDENKLFDTDELEWLGKCVKFTVRHNGDLKFDDCEFLEKLNEKISENIPEQQPSDELEMLM